MALNLFDARRTKWVDLRTGELTREAQIFLRDLWLRIGGSDAPTNNELVVADDDDAGLEESKAELGKLANTFGQEPPTDLMQGAFFIVSAAEYERFQSMETALHELEKRVAGLEQGTAL